MSAYGKLSLMKLLCGRERMVAGKWKNLPEYPPLQDKPPGF